MKKLVVAAVCFAMSHAAFAEGWECYEKDKGPVVAKVYHYRGSDAGTRTAAFLVLSNRRVNEGRQTIATFSEWDNTLTNEGTTYIAEVDKRRSEIQDGELIPNRAGEGARLGNVDSVMLEVNYNYADTPLMQGGQRTGTLTVNKRDGGSFKLKMYCYRYLVD